jgi:hypothetical protein
MRHLTHCRLLPCATGNHAKTVPPAGPGHGPTGNGAWFDGVKPMEVAHSPAMSSRDLTVSFWMYLLEDSTNSYRTLLRKASSVQDMTPALMLLPNDRRLHIRLSTTATSSSAAVVGFDSTAVIPLRRWTHVAYVLRGGAALSLYVNGVKDCPLLSTNRRGAGGCPPGGSTYAWDEGDVKFNSGPLYVGADPFMAGANMFLDSLKIFNQALPERDIALESNDGTAIPPRSSPLLLPRTSLAALPSRLHPLHRLAYSSLSLPTSHLSLGHCRQPLLAPRVCELHARRAAARVRRHGRVSPLPVPGAHGRRAPLCSGDGLAARTIERVAVPRGRSEPSHVRPWRLWGGWGALGLLLPRLSASPPRRVAVAPRASMRVQRQPPDTIGMRGLRPLAPAKHAEVGLAADRSRELPLHHDDVSRKLGKQARSQVRW